VSGGPSERQISAKRKITEKKDERTVDLASAHCPCSLRLAAFDSSLSVVVPLWVIALLLGSRTAVERFTAVLATNPLVATSL
jgi:hypothetical protein